MTRDDPSRALLALAVLSGGASLVYEVIWLRWFGLLFGSTAYSAAVTLCAFFLGLAIGSLLLGRWAGRTRRPLRGYASVEAGAAACALLVPLAVTGYDALYGGLYASLADSRPLFVLAKLALALAAMLPATILLGGTLPLLAAAALRSGSQLGRRGNQLYGANLAGGVLGAAVGGLVLPEWLGVPGTYAVGIVATGLAAVSAGWLSRHHHGATHGEDPTAGRDSSLATSFAAVAPRPSVPVSALGTAGISGFGLLALQVLLVSALGQFFAHSVYTFGLVLVAVLGSMAVGAWAVAASEGRVPAGAGLCVVLGVQGILLLLLPWGATSLRDGLLASGGSASFLDTPVAQAVACVGLLGVPALLTAGLVFPLTFRLVGSGPVGPSLGRLLAVNTLGGIAGSLAVPFWMLEKLGLWGSFAALGLLYCAAALAAARDIRLRTGLLLAAAVGIVVALPTNPWTMPRVRLGEGERLLASLEGAHGLVTVVERASGTRHLAIDQHYQFGSTRHTALYERMGRLPLLLHPDPKRVLVVGSATGGLAAGPVSLPVKAIDLVEIVPEVHTLAARYFAAHNRGVHHDPRTRLVAEDGRNHLRASPARYDVVIEDLFVPQRPTAAAMYTVEHYRDVRAHLSESGVFCQWLPLYQLSRTQLSIIVRSFLEAFPEATLWTPTFRPPWILGLVGAPDGHPGVSDLSARLRDGSPPGIEDAWLYDEAGLWTFYLGPASTLARLAPAPGINSDAHPIFEFVSARTPLARTQRFSADGWPRLVAELLASAPEPDPIFPERSPELARAGQALARLNAAPAAAAPRATWRDIQERIPARLLEEQDPSVSARWPALPAPD